MQTGPLSRADGASASPGRGRNLTDAQITLLVGALLFVLAAWPLALVPVPPLQDLPNHLATATILAHPAEYPVFVFNGFF